MGIDQVKATLQQGIHAAEKAKEIIQSVRDGVRETRTLAQATVHDSQHDAAQRGLRLVGEAVHETELVLRRLQDSTEATENYLRTLG